MDTRVVSITLGYPKHFLALFYMLANVSCLREQVDTVWRLVEVITIVAK